MKPTPVSAFGSRLIEAFRGIGIKNLTGIANKLGVQNSAVTNYVQGRIPPFDTLSKIASFTNCSIHWLVTNEEPKWKLQMTKVEREAIEVLAEQYDRKFAEIFEDIMLAGTAYVMRRERPDLHLSLSLSNGDVMIGTQEDQIIRQRARENNRTAGEEIRDLVRTILNSGGLPIFPDDVWTLLELEEGQGDSEAGETLRKVIMRELRRLRDLQKAPEQGGTENISA